MTDLPDDLKITLAELIEYRIEKAKMDCAERRRALRRAEKILAELEEIAALITRVQGSSR